MALRKNSRVYFDVGDGGGSRPIVGTVRQRSGREALVFWDDDFDARGNWVGAGQPEDRWYAVEALREVGADDAEAPVEEDDDVDLVGTPRAGAVGVPLIYAPQIQDLEFATRVHPKTNTLVMERAQSYRGGPGPALVDSRDVYELWKHMSELDGEHIVVALLDIRNNLIGWKPVHKGKLASVEADIRDILKDALLMNAAKIIILHNHPSGDPGPSEADAELTQALEEMAGEFSIELWDHVVIGRGDHYSFRDEGFISSPEEDG